MEVVCYRKGTAINVLDLFSGIGGMSLGLERSSCTFKTVAFVEIEPHARTVLSKHWPGVPCFTDVRTLRATDLPTIDVITGGFPCTDLSQAAKGSHTGLAGEHSGLVYEFGRLATECQPEWLIIENVPQVKKYKKELQEIFTNYELTYNDTDALDFGADCRRKRTFIIGHLRACGGLTVSIKPVRTRETRENGGISDNFPMLLPWKGGVSLERLASCLVSSAEADTCRVREGIRLPYRVGDGVLYLLTGNSLCPNIPEAIGREILSNYHCTV